MDSHEVRWAIGPFLRRADLLACLQVCKAWHDSFIGLVYSHIEIDETSSKLLPSPTVIQNHGHLVQSLSLTLHDPAPLTPLMEQVLVTVYNLRLLTLTFKPPETHEALRLETEDDELGLELGDEWTELGTEAGTVTTATDEREEIETEAGTAATTTDELGDETATVTGASTGLKQILGNNPGLRRLEISHLTTPTTLPVQQIAHDCRSLTELKLSEVSLDLSELISVLAFCQDLRRLNLDRCAVSDTADEYDEMQMPLQLKDLQYASNTGSGSWSLSDCLTLFPLLDSIKYEISRTNNNGTIGGLGNLSNIVALTEEERDRRPLSKLALKNLPLSTQELSSLLDSYPRLIDLSLGGARRGIMQVAMDENLFHTLSAHPRFPYLTSLDLHDCHPYQGWMTQQILSTCSRLTSLGVETLTVDDLFTAVPGGEDIFWHWSCTSMLKRLRIRTLVLASSDRVRNNRTMDQLESLTNLEEIEIQEMVRQTSQQSWTLRSEDPKDRLTKLCHVGEYTNRASLARDATLWWTVDVWPKLRRFINVGWAEDGYD
ncbi:hypothetical protein BGZ83_005975 [Gryganskiella cystojenkinii]|nr:hypothetical protein BGZ83_005975 [Gryganskiella cystojenkinii]